MPRPNAVPARARDGAHWSARPVVRCAHVTTGQPPLGALPFGTDTVPETATALPATPAERYSSSRSRPPPDSAIGAFDAIAFVRIRSPWVRPGSFDGGA